MTQCGSAVLDTSTRVTQRGTGSGTEALLCLCVGLCVGLGVFVCFCWQVSTLGVAEENEAPDAGGAADDQARSQHHTVRHLPTQPAHKEEAQDDLHPTQAVHQTVAQLTEAEVVLRQRRHHGLGLLQNTLQSGVEAHF